MTWLSRFITWVHSDEALRLAAMLVGAAVVTERVTPGHTIANHIATGVVGAGTLLGITSTIGREPKQ